MSVGNRRLAVLTSVFRDKYLAARNKDEKSAIVTDILTTIQQSCPDQRGAFVRYSNGRWWEVEDIVAREKIGAVMRDSIGTKYRSSIKSKVAIRRWRRESERQTEEESQQEPLSMMCHSSNKAQYCIIDYSPDSVLSGRELVMSNIFDDDSSCDE